MAVTNYVTVNGMLIGESTNGVNRAYGLDALGSVVATYTGSSVQNTYVYKPYGGLLAKTGSGTDPSYLWNGGSGYRATMLLVSGYYVRRRHYSPALGSWTSLDANWPDVTAFAYIKGNPTLLSDWSGAGGGVPGSGSGSGGVSCINASLPPPSIYGPCVNVNWVLDFSFKPPCVSGYVVQMVTRTALYSDPCLSTPKIDPNSQPSLYWELWEIDANGFACDGYCTPTSGGQTPSNQDEFHYQYAVNHTPPNGACGVWSFVGVMKFFSGAPPKWDEPSGSLPITTSQPSFWLSQPIIFQRTITGVWDCFKVAPMPVLFFDSL